MKKWQTRTVKEYDIEEKLNSLENAGHTIFSILFAPSGFHNYYIIVYY